AHRGRTRMANPRPEDKSTQNLENARHFGERTVEQTARVAQGAAEAGEQVARVGADLLRQNAQMLENAFRFGLDTTNAVMGRSTDQLSRTLGLSGNEAQQAVERSARNTETILRSSTTVSRGMGRMSQEYFEFVRRQIENSLECMNELWRCRTPHDLAALQTDLVRSSVETALESSRRMADISLKSAEDAAKRMTESLEQAQRAA